MKVVVGRYLSSDATPHPYVQFFVMDGDELISEMAINLASHDFDAEDLRTFVVTEILAFTNDPGGLNLTLTEDDVIGNIPPKSTQSPATHSLTSNTGAAGFQVSDLKNADVRYSVSVLTESTLLTPESGDVVLEIAPTNSAAPGDWVEVGRFGSGNPLGILSSTVNKGQICGLVPAGYYAKLRTINNSGTPVFAYVSGQEVLVG